MALIFNSQGNDVGIKESQETNPEIQPSLMHTTDDEHKIFCWSKNCLLIQKFPFGGEIACWSSQSCERRRPIMLLSVCPPTASGRRFDHNAILRVCDSIAGRSQTHLLKRAGTPWRSFGAWWPLAWNYAGRGWQKNMLLYLQLHRLVQQQGPLQRRRLTDEFWQIPSMPLPAPRCQTNIFSIFWLRFRQIAIKRQNQRPMFTWCPKFVLTAHPPLSSNGSLWSWAGDGPHPPPPSLLPLPYCTSNTSDASLMKVNHRGKASYNPPKCCFVLPRTFDCISSSSDR